MLQHMYDKVVCCPLLPCHVRDCATECSTASYTASYSFAGHMHTRSQRGRKSWLELNNFQTIFKKKVTMFSINLRTVATWLVIPYFCHCKIDSGSLPKDSDTMFHNSLTALSSPSQCHLLVICAILQSGDSKLTNSSFMQGISTLADYRGDHPLKHGLGLAIQTGTLQCTVINTFIPL